MTRDSGLVRALLAAIGTARTERFTTCKTVGARTAELEQSPTQDFMYLEHRDLRVTLFNQVSSGKKHVLFERIGDDHSLDFSDKLEHVHAEQVGIVPRAVSAQLVYQHRPSISQLVDSFLIQALHGSNPRRETIIFARRTLAIY
ncbi:hypothetical protein [Caballeronia arvi]|uniref:hypothetical protein n=1 Tax=Caballeronia arvi TaxID=1777135 RepID=UPI00135B7984|nr:hypothetical protein [Caballeronia arvi]